MQLHDQNIINQVNMLNRNPLSFACLEYFLVHVQQKMLHVIQVLVHQVGQKNAEGIKECNMTFRDAKL